MADRSAPDARVSRFRGLWVGSTLSLIGSALTTFALPLQLYDVTRSSLAVGLLGVAEFIPTL
ncbi:MAG: MFS transporter, partial [Solirubrobacterales bacterium]|nr:MFS transporter [Solirubrobacterales bacterium]